VLRFVFAGVQNFVPLLWKYGKRPDIQKLYHRIYKMGINSLMIRLCEGGLEKEKGGDCPRPVICFAANASRS